MRYLMAGLLLLACESGAFAQSKCAAIPDQKLRLECYDAKSSPQPAERGRQAEGTIKTDEMTNYVAMIDKALLERGINVSVTVQTKCGKFDGLAGSPTACPALSFLGKYIDRPTTYALVTKVLNSFTEARALGFKNVVFYGLNRQEGSRHTFDLTKPPPTCSLDLCF
jgi:hypothetical protein